MKIVLSVNATAFKFILLITARCIHFVCRGLYIFTWTDTYSFFIFIHSRVPKSCTVHWLVPSVVCENCMWLLIEFISSWCCFRWPGPVNIFYILISMNFYLVKKRIDWLMRLSDNESEREPHNLWMRVTMVLKAAWTSAAEQVDTMGWPWPCSTSATYWDREKHTHTHIRHKHTSASGGVEPPWFIL